MATSACSAHSSGVPGGPSAGGFSWRWHAARSFSSHSPHHSQSSHREFADASSEFVSHQAEELLDRPGVLLDHLVYDHHADTHPAHPPVVLLHGLLGSKQNFRSFAKGLHSPRVIIADLRNHGQSPHTPSMALEEMAADVLQLLEFHQVDRAVLMGHSMGGKVVMAASLLHSHRVKGLVSMDMAPVVYNTGMDARTGPRNVTREGYSTRDIVRLIGAIPVAECASAREVGEILQREMPNITPGMKAFLLQNFALNRQGLGSWTFNIETIHRVFDSQLVAWPFEAPQEHARSDPPPTSTTTTPATRAYAGPSLFVRGGKSMFVSDDALPSIRAFFPRAQVETLHDAGHWVHADKPTDTLRLLNAFLEQVAAQGP